MSLTIGCQDELKGILLHRDIHANKCMLVTGKVNVSGLGKNIIYANSVQFSKEQESTDNRFTYV